MSLATLNTVRNNPFMDAKNAVLRPIAVGLAIGKVAVDLSAAGCNGALDGTWRNPYVTNGVIGGLAAGLAISCIASLKATSQCDTYSITPIQNEAAPDLQYTTRKESAVSTRKIQSIAAKVTNKIPRLTNIEKYLLGPAIFAAKVYDYAYPTSLISTILRPAIEPAQKAKMWFALGLFATASTISHIASAPMTEAIDAITPWERTPRNVGQATMKAMAHHIAHSVKEAALWGAGAAITAEAGKKIAWHYIQKALFDRN